MRKAFADFRSALPNVARTYVLAGAVGGPVCVLIAVVGYRLPLDEAVPLIAAFLVALGPPLLGPIWVRGWVEPMSLRALLFAAVWFLALSAPGLVLGTLTFVIARGIFD